MGLRSASPQVNSLRIQRGKLEVGGQRTEGKKGPLRLRGRGERADDGGRWTAGGRQRTEEKKGALRLRTASLED